MSGVTFEYDICHVAITDCSTYLSTMNAFRIFLGISLFSNLISIWFHNAHGLLRGGIWPAFLLSILGYGILQGMVKRKTIPHLSVLSALLALILQHRFLDLRFQGFDGQSQESLWVISVYLFVPLLFLCWYSKIKYVIAYILLGGIADILIGIGLQPHFQDYVFVASKGIFWRTAAFLVMGVSIAYLLQRLRIANQLIQSYALSQTNLTESRERNRIARELHDTLAHSLSALAIQLEAIDATWESNTSQNRLRIQDALATTRSGLTETRRAIQNLKSHTLECHGLSSAIHQYAEQACARVAINLDAHIETLATDLPESISHGFFRIAQEALENVVRHSQATQVHIHLNQDRKETKLRIQDNGVGFEALQAPANHFGLQGMRERAMIMGANLQIQSKNGCGCTVDLYWSNEL